MPLYDDAKAKPRRGGGHRGRAIRPHASLCSPNSKHLSNSLHGISSVVRLLGGIAKLGIKPTTFLSEYQTHTTVPPDKMAASCARASLAKGVVTAPFGLAMEYEACPSMTTPKRSPGEGADTGAAPPVRMPHCALQTANI